MSKSRTVLPDFLDRCWDLFQYWDMAEYIPVLQVVEIMSAEQPPRKEKEQESHFATEERPVAVEEKNSWHGTG